MPQMPQEIYIFSKLNYLLSYSLIYLFIFLNSAVLILHIHRVVSCSVKENCFHDNKQTTIVAKLLPVSMEICYVVASNIVQRISLFLLLALSFVLFVYSRCKNSLDCESF